MDEGVGHDDEHGREGHQGGGDARFGVLHGHQRERHAEERSEEGGQGGEGHACGNEPNRLLAVSANKAVAVHEKATISAMISPKYWVLIVCLSLRCA